MSFARDLGLRSERVTKNALSLTLALNGNTWSPGGKLQGRIHIEAEKGPIPIAWCRIRLQCVLVGKLQTLAGPQKMLPSTHTLCVVSRHLSIPKTKENVSFVPFELTIPFGPETATGDSIYVGWSLFVDQLIPVGRSIAEVTELQDFLPNHVGMTVPIVTHTLTQTPELHQILNPVQPESSAEKGLAQLETLAELDRVFGEGFYGYQKKLTEDLHTYLLRYKNQKKSNKRFGGLFAIAWAIPGVWLLNEGGSSSKLADLLAGLVISTISFFPLYFWLKSILHRLRGTLSAQTISAPDFIVKGTEAHIRLQLARTGIRHCKSIDWHLIYSQRNELNLRVRRRRQSFIQSKLETHPETIQEGTLAPPTEWKNSRKCEINLSIPVPVNGNSTVVGEAPRKDMRPDLRTSLVQHWELVISMHSGKQVFEERIPLTVVPFCIDSKASPPAGGT